MSAIFLNKEYTKEGIVLPRPHAFWIWRDTKKLIINSESFDDKLDKNLYFIEKREDKDICYGIIKLVKIEEMDLEDWSRLKDIHKISDEERNKRWGDKNKLYAYNFEVVERFTQPKEASISKETNTFVSDIKLGKELVEQNFVSKELAKQAFGSPGGKSRIVKKLIPLIPKHKTYIECFAGGAAVFWNKERSDVEVLNDFDPEIANAYKITRDITQEQINKLKKKNWVDSKSTFFYLKDKYKPKDNLDAYYRFLYLLKVSYGLERTTYGYKNVTVNQIHKYLDNLPKLAERLKGVKIFNADYISVIKKYDGPDTFIYLDPPYPKEWGFITDAFTEKDYKEMKDLLKNIKGKFLLSSNIMPWIKELFKEFDIKKILVPRTLAKNDKPDFEYLISNYSKELAETSAGSVAGGSFTGGGLQPVGIAGEKEKRKKPKVGETKIKLAEEELFVKKRGDRWCVTHSDGKIIKCFPTKEEANRMHKAIIISKIKRGKMDEELKEETEKIENLHLLLEQFKPITLINNFLSVVGSTIKRENGTKPGDIDLHIRMGENFKDYIKRATEVRLMKMLDEDTADKIHLFGGDAEGSHDTFVPVYNLALVPSERKIIEMSLLDKLEEDLFLPYVPQKPSGSAYYEIDKSLDFVKEGKQYLIEYKFNGFHAVVMKEGDNIKIYSEQKKDLTKAFPTLIEEINKISSSDFIIDGELVPYKGDKALGRNELMKYIGAIKSGKTPDDSNVKLHVWDMIYYNKDLKELPLKERIIYLKKLKFSSRITGTENKVISSKKEAKRAIRWVSSLKNSEGAVIKDLDSPYTYGKSRRTWVKYRHLTPLNVIIIKRVPKERGLFNYLVGVPARKKYLDPKYVTNNVLVLGHTFNTKDSFSPGKIIHILVEEVWRHETRKGVHYSIHKPRVKGKTSESVSTIDDLEDIVTSIGVVVTHAFLFNQSVLVGEDLAEKINPQKGEEGRELEIKNFPQRMQKNFKEVMDKKLWLPFVIQWHLRGERSLHSDNRFKIPSNYLEGFTYFTPPSLDKPNLLTPKKANNIRGTIKLQQPVEWLKVTGRFTKGQPGTTSKHDAFFTIVSKGKYTIHEVDDHRIVFELRCDKGKVYKFDEKKNPEPYIKEFNRKLPDRLLNLSGTYSYHIAHIGEHYIILLDKLKK